MENVSEHQLFSVKNNSSIFLYTTLCVNALTVHIASCVYFFCNIVCTHDGRGCIPLQYLTFLTWYEVEIRTNDTPCKMMTYDDI